MAKQHLITTKKALSPSSSAEVSQNSLTSLGRNIQETPCHKEQAEICWLGGAWDTLFVLSVPGCCWDFPSHCSAGLLAPPHVLLWFYGDSVAIVPTLPHHTFSVREMGAPASLQPFLDILVGLWEIGQGWGMEGTGTCCGGGCVRSHPEMSGLPGMLEVGHQPASLSQGRIVLLAPVASCPGKP